MVVFARALLLGILSWLIPFVTSQAAAPLRRMEAQLFSSLMYLVVLLTGSALLSLYFQDRKVFPGEALLVGLLWSAMSLMFDYPVVAFGTARLTPLSYYSEVGLAYLTFPILAVFGARLTRQQR